MDKVKIMTEKDCPSGMMLSKPMYFSKVFIPVANVMCSPQKFPAWVSFFSRYCRCWRRKTEASILLFPAAVTIQA